MLKPSDFNNAVPQFQNGNYASNPINPKYVEEPSSTDYNRGSEPLQTLPAQWWNWFMNKFTSRFNKVNIYVKNLFNELAQLLSLVNVTPDGTEGAVTDGQLKNAFKELYPDYINTKLALKATYVKKTQKVNNHALSGDITVTKSDVGLGSVANTGDSANASSGGTNKFTTGGAYNLLSSIAPYFSTSTAYTVGTLITYQNRLYECTTAHSAGAWDASHFTARSVQYVINNYILPSLAPAFSTSTSYTVGAFVIYQNRLYRCKATHSAGAWNTSHFELATLNDINTSLGTKADLLDLASAFSISVSYAVGDYVTYNGNLYRCTVAHSGAWNASHFTLVTVGGDLAKKTDVTDFDDATDITTHFDNAPYTSRVTDYDRASTDSIIGASFAVNQLVKNGNFANTSNWNFTSGTVSVSYGTATLTASSQYGWIVQSIPIRKGHQMLVIGTCKSYTNTGTQIKLRQARPSNPYFDTSRTLSTTKTTYAFVVPIVDDTTYCQVAVQDDNASGWGAITIENVQAIDLTQMFGSAIADRIRAMEDASARSGVAWIKSFGFFNKSYYETDEGSIQSVKPSAHKVSSSIVSNWRSRNQSAQYTVCLFADALLKTNTTYTLYFRGANGAGIYVNENLFGGQVSVVLDGTLQSVTYTTLGSLPSDQKMSEYGLEGWVIFKNRGGNTVTPNFTEFYIVEEGVNADPSFSQSTPLANTDLRGIPKLDSNNNLYFDGDVYYPNGDVIRRYASLTNQSGAVGETITLTGYKTNGNIICSKGAISNIGTISGTTLTLTSAISGETIIYELATPTKEKVAGYSNPHTLIRKGAEEFVDDRTIPLPVGHETTYLSLPDWMSTTDPFAIGVDSGVYTELANKVDKATTVNGHALSGNVTVTKGDVGLGSVENKDLGNVENTGDSAIPTENGITKFTTGGAFDFFGGNTNANAWLGRVFGWALGRNWSQGTGLMTGYFDFVYYADGIWVAGSASHGLWWSTDGKTWIQGQGTTSTYTFLSVYYANGIWVAGSENHGLLWSTDRTTWTQGSGVTGYTFNFVYYANGIWVAGSDSHGLWWSTDGKTWTQATGTTSTYAFNFAYYANGIWVAGSDSHGLWWSTDGKTWTQGTGAVSNASFRSIYYANGTWVAGSFTLGLWWSTDGKTWTQATGTISTYTFFSVYYANGIWVAGSDEEGLYWSTDGKTWIQGQGSIINYTFRSIYYANGTWVAGSAEGGLYWSTDGKTWIQGQGSMISYMFRSVYNANGIWVAGSAGHGLWYSDFTNADIQ